jgi:hypothetical protein
MTDQTKVTVGSYRIEFERDLTRPLDPAEVVAAPYKGQIVPIPFSVFGEPGLIDVRIHAQKIHDGAENSLVKGFSAVLAPKGMCTAWTRKDAMFRGVLEVPTHMLPVKVAVTISNLSESI